MTFVALFSLLVGLAIVGQWVLFLIGGQVPELQTQLVAIVFHLVAEAITALALIAAAVAIFLRRPRAARLGLLANGMLVYTVIASAGYFAQLENWNFVGMFAVILLFAGLSIGLLFRHRPGATGS